ncbi:hypothetical protein HK104_000715 [Borealophlyctis nickersoniae]|nr:hypothetical protein HK104_000715 [Borealophlyctis nickersoniae]
MQKQEYVEEELTNSSQLVRQVRSIVWVIYVLANKNSWENPAFPTAMKWVSFLIDTVIAGVACVGVAGAALASHRVMSAFVIIYRSLVGVSLFRAIALPVLAYLRRDDLVTTCQKWTEANQASSPQKPECGTAMTYAVGTLAVLGSLDFIFSLWVYTAASNYRKFLDISSNPYGILPETSSITNPGNRSSGTGSIPPAPVMRGASPDMPRFDPSKRTDGDSHLATDEVPLVGESRPVSNVSHPSYGGYGRGYGTYGR